MIGKGHRFDHSHKKKTFARIMVGPAAEHGEENTVMINAKHLKAHGPETRMNAKFENPKTVSETFPQRAARLVDVPILFNLLLVLVFNLWVLARTAYGSHAEQSSDCRRRASHDLKQEARALWWVAFSLPADILP